MAITVTMQVGPVDREKFLAATKWADSKGPFAGFRARKVLFGEHDPKTALVVEEWDSHDSFHAASDAVGDEFNKRAGTEGLDWITGVWVGA
jgi:heme-degrading monooxygenase HmoA